MPFFKYHTAQLLFVLVIILCSCTNQTKPQNHVVVKITKAHSFTNKSSNINFYADLETRTDSLIILKIHKEIHESAATFLASIEPLEITMIFANDDTVHAGSFNIHSSTPNESQFPYYMMYYPRLDNYIKNGRLYFWKDWDGHVPPSK